MRTRLLRPGYFENEQLAALPPHARLLFAGLWCLADREGRLKDRPAVIRAQVFPFEDIAVDPLLAALAAAGFITRYVAADGDKAVQIRAFDLHQHPHHREAESRIAPPPETRKSRRNSAGPRKSPGSAPAQPRLGLADPDLDPDTNTDPDTAAAAEPRAAAAFPAYVAIAAQALRLTLIEHHSEHVSLVSERFRRLCDERHLLCEPELAAQAIAAAVEARNRKAAELLARIPSARRAGRF